MRLSIQKNKKDTHLYAFESYRDPKTKLVKTQVAKDFGVISELEKTHPNPIEWAREEIKKLNNERKENKLYLSKQYDFSLPVLEIDSRYSKSRLRNIGWIYLKKLYDALEIDKFLDSLKGRQKYSLNDINLLLTMGRILDPCSKRSTHDKQDFYFGMNEIDLPDIYKFLDVINEHSEELQKHLYENTKKIIDLDTSVLYYDMTNFYFEIEDADPDILDPNDPTKVLEYGFRRYGVSKEHRPNPIVELGLFIDSNGIPISYCLEHGGKNEQTTPIPLERRMMRDYKETKFIYCADGGLNSFLIRGFNSIQGRNYVVTQSLKQINDEELEYIFKDLNWKFVDDDTPASLNQMKNIIQKYKSGEALTEEENKILNKDMIYKDYPMTRKVDVKEIFGLDSSAYKTFDETLYITFSAKCFLYQDHVFSRQLTRAEDYIEKGRIKINKNMNDPKRLILEEHITKNGELATNVEASIDKDKVNEESRFHGFYACATSLTKTNVKEIIKINERRWQIEMKFKIMKSYLDGRPTYMHLKEHIGGHFVICYEALLIYSILENLMNSNKEKFTIEDILKTIKAMNIVEENPSIYSSQYTNSKTLKRLETITNLGLDHQYFKGKDLEKSLNKKITYNK